MKYEEYLIRLIELRKYSELLQHVSELIEEGQWSHFIADLSELQLEEAKICGWDMPLRYGVVRDAMIEILNLHHLNGIDGGLCDHFADLRSDSIYSLRDEAQALAIEILKNQIRKGNTFFLNVDELSTTECSVLIPDIVRIRQRQIESLSSEPTFGEICSTYYGFTILTSGGVKEDSSRASNESLAMIKEIAAKLGQIIEMNSKQIRWSPRLFGRLSDYTKKLLWNLLSLCIGGYHSQVKAANYLGNIGDSRALDLLHERLEGTENSSISRAIIQAIGKMGHPASYEILKPFLTKTSPYRTNLEQIIKAIGGVRHYNVYHYLNQQLTNLVRISEPILDAITQTRNYSFIPQLKKFYQLSIQRGWSLEKAILKTLQSLGPEGISSAEELQKSFKIA